MRQTVLVNRAIQAKLPTVETLVSFGISSTPVVLAWLGTTDTSAVERVEFSRVQGSLRALQKLVLF